MCVAIYKPADVELDPDDLWNCWIDNSDGMGIAVATGKELLVYRDMTDFSFIRDMIEKHTKHPMIVHFRIATHGTTDLDNCHPFLISDKIAMCHNGIISGMNDFGGSRSDTKVFAEDYLAPIVKAYPNILENVPFLGMVAQVAGSWNRIAFLTADGRYAIINEDDGEWLKGAWFSNTHWQWTNWKNTYVYDPNTEKHTLNNTKCIDMDDESIRETYRLGGASAVFDAVEEDDPNDPRCAVCELPIYEGEAYCTIENPHQHDTQHKTYGMSTEMVCEACTMGKAELKKLEPDEEEQDIIFEAYSG